MQKMHNLEESAPISGNRDSYLSVVADSANVKVIVIKRGMIEFIPRKVKKNLLSRIRHFEDIDRPFNRQKFEAQKAGLRNWNLYKEKLAASIIGEKKKKAY